MTTLHWRVIGLLAWLTFFFNLERLSTILGQNLVMLSSVVLTVAVLAAIIPLLPLFQSRSLLSLAVGVGFIYASAFVIVGMFTSTNIPLWQGTIELGALFVTVWLSQRAAQGFGEFRRAVEMLTLTVPNAKKRLRSLEETREMVDMEMARSRRFERPLSLVMVQADTNSINMNMHRLVQEIQRSMMQRFVLATMAHELSRTLRRTDIVVEDENPGRLLLVAPETNESEALKMGSRVSKLIEERLGVSASYGIAAFPEQALTFEDLRQIAETQMQTGATAATNETNSEVLELGPRPMLTAPEKERVRA